MLQKSLIIAKNSLKRKNLSVMVGKTLVRLQEANQKAVKNDVVEWCNKNAEPYDVYLKALDQDLWEETKEICAKLAKSAEKKLEAIDIDLGGGGNTHLLYFFTRYISAKTILETGVAAGWSSQALLTAINMNDNGGHLYSSDFPYFRHDNPEELIGYVVDQELKNNWTLLIDGDQNNLPRILQDIETVDLFHYDSDKSYKGRVFATDLMMQKLHDKSVILFDDIQDNAHFRDYVETRDLEFKVFEFHGKYVGLILPPL